MDIKLVLLLAVVGLVAVDAGRLRERLRRKHFRIQGGIDVAGGYDCDDDDDDDDRPCGGRRVEVVKKVIVEKRPSVIVVPTVETSVRRTFFSTYGEEQCPLSEDECVCVPRESCARGYIIEDGTGVINRRGKRTVGLSIGGSIGGGIIGGIGGAIGGVLGGHGYGRRSGGCYHGCGGGYGGYGSGFFGVSVGIPTIDVSVHKSVNVGSGCSGRRCAPRPEVHVVEEFDNGCGYGIECRVVHRRPRPRPTVIHKEVHVEVPTVIRKEIHVEVPTVEVSVGRRRRPDTFVPCENCGGSSKPKESRSVITTTRREKVCHGDKVCCRSKSAGSALPQGACGQRQACGVDRKTGASSRVGETEFGEYPWQAMILRVDSNTGKREFLCNGVLIDNKRILTVAQCVQQYERYPNEIEVRFGEWDVSSDVEIYPHETYPVQDIEVHPQYKNTTLINDIAIVTLTEYVKNEAHISPICLPPAKQQFAYGSCVVTGWGNRDPVLKESPVDCLNDEDCESRLRSTKLGPYYKLHHSFLCATNKNGESCQIDGGGPLVCKRKDGSYALVGLVSWAADCDAQSVPEAYCRVQNYLGWINGDGQQSGQAGQSSGY